MACVSEIICLGEFCSCGNEIELPLIAELTGNYTLYATFNGVRLVRNLTTIEGQNINIPNIFNENYTHEFYLVGPNGEILGDTHYSLSTVFCLNIDTDMPEDNLPISIIVVADAGVSLIDNRLVGRIVTAYIINDISKNTDFNKPINSNTLTLLNGNIFEQNAVVTILFQ